MSMLDAFGNSVNLPYILSLPIPFLEDIFEAQLEYLKEKNKLEREALDKSKAQK